jgi:bla regulator protein BlaR1
MARGPSQSIRKLLWIILVGTFAMTAPVAFELSPVLLAAQQTSSQATTPTSDDWETVAGGKMSFDVTSVKLSDPSVHNSDSNMSFFGDRYPPSGGLFSARNQELSDYIAFAYKLTWIQSRMLNSTLPKWAAEAHYDIQARGPDGITKDQMRLMMQSLLVDRFGLKTHFESRETKIYALRLVKPGVTGPKFRPHTENPPCADPSTPVASAAGLNKTAAGFPMTCNTPIGFASANGAAYAGRNLAIEQIAEGLTIAPNGVPIDRPVVDQTGLTGKFDFILNYSPQWNTTAPQPDDNSPPLFEAMKDQLGLKLDAIAAPYRNLVVDHIEPPAPN